MRWSASIVRKVPKRVLVRLATSATTALAALRISRRVPPQLGATVAVEVPLLLARHVPKDICAKEAPRTSRVVEGRYSLAIIVLVEHQIQLLARRVSTVQVAQLINYRVLQHLASTVHLDQSPLLVFCARWDIFAVEARVTRQYARLLWANTVRQEPTLQRVSDAQSATIAQVVQQILSLVLQRQGPIAMKAAQWPLARFARLDLSAVVDLLIRRPVPEQRRRGPIARCPPQPPQAVYAPLASFVGGEVVNLKRALPFRVSSAPRALHRMQQRSCVQLGITASAGLRTRHHAPQLPDITVLRDQAVLLVCRSAFLFYRRRKNDFCFRFLRYSVLLILLLVHTVVRGDLRTSPYARCRLPSRVWRKHRLQQPVIGGNIARGRRESSRRSRSNLSPNWTTSTKVFWKAS
mmetsp:Transcript_4987/g.15733  ORF Transcript_4987/g.15733 Transcript_4987/m.15733 type:complete len:407 (+) Transcript_4987:5902-7122(+)